MLSYRQSRFSEGFERSARVNARRLQSRAATRRSCRRALASAMKEKVMPYGFCHAGSASGRVMPER